MIQKTIIRALVVALKRVRGISEVLPLNDQDRLRIQEVENEAQERSLMGLGKVVNDGVIEVLNRPLVLAALTTMEFDWGLRPSLVLKKGPVLVGEEVRDPDRLSELGRNEDAWFMHENFVIYKSRMSFPRDLLTKDCFFEIPWYPAEWDELEGLGSGEPPMIYGFVSPPADAFLKEKYFPTAEEKGMGTILIGVGLQPGETDGNPASPEAA